MSILLKGPMKQVLDENWHVREIPTDKLSLIVEWCRSQFGEMLSDYHQMARWYGSHYSIAGNKHYFIALRDERDYLLYTLKWE